jgi:hypothetical protein
MNYTDVLSLIAKVPNWHTTLADGVDMEELAEGRRGS